ncbi:MAG: terminase family protein [Pseudomonadota bacterium]
MATVSGGAGLGWTAWHDPQFIRGKELDRRQALLLRQFPFLAMARAAQRPPIGDWRTWLFIGGRGAGKTRAGAEWTRFSALHGHYRRIALIGPTLSDVREVMIEGPSGIRSIEPLVAQRPVFNVSRRRLEWPNGAVGLIFSAEDADSLRGPQFDGAWCDEIAVWSQGEAVWNNLQLALRLGRDPRCVATTTPKPVPLVRRLISSDAIVTHSATEDNQANLAPGFVSQMHAEYAGTQLERQELGGELLEDAEGALWRRSDLDRDRVSITPTDFDDIVIAIDPPVTSHRHSDACGMIAAGRARAPGFEDKCFILADASVRGMSPADWASRARALASLHGASRIVAEANQGGEMLRTVLETAGCRTQIDLVHARLGKLARATPVAALYNRGRVAHVGSLSALEDEMCLFGTDDMRHSPDRVDAMVWAVTALMLDGRGAPRIRGL